MKKAIVKAAEFLKKNDCFCFLCHRRLDGDTLGAALSLYYACIFMGKQGVIRTYQGESLEKFSFLYPNECFYEKGGDFKVKHYVSVDVADYKLLEQEFNNVEFSLSIDHHEINRLKAKIECVDKKRAATCEIVYLILKELKIKITKNIADCLYLGIVTDTGSFKYQNVSSTTHKIVARLIEKGADFHKISSVAFNRKTKKRLKLEKEVISNLEYYFDDRVVIVFITDDMIKRANATKEDCNSVSYIAASFEDAFFAITATQEEDGFKISVRSKGEYDSSLFCKKYGGGGHKKAAGCTIKGGKETVLKSMLKELKECFKF